ncbi:MAG: hypothetical protein ACTSRP_01975 [Candidatus Helarchaeota archaeon]
MGRKALGATILGAILGAATFGVGWLPATVSLATAVATGASIGFLVGGYFQYREIQRSTFGDIEVQESVYSSRGINARLAKNSPIPIIYGTCKVGAQILNYTFTSGDLIGERKKDLTSLYDELEYINARIAEITSIDRWQDRTSLKTEYRGLVNRKRRIQEEIIPFWEQVRVSGKPSNYILALYGIGEAIYSVDRREVDNDTYEIVGVSTQKNVTYSVSEKNPEVILKEWNRFNDTEYIEINEQLVESSEPVHGEPHTFEISTSRDYEAVILNLQSPSGIFYICDDGDIETVYMHFVIRYRKLGVTNDQICDSPDYGWVEEKFYLEARVQESYRTSILVEFPEAGQYELMVWIDYCWRSKDIRKRGLKFW